jgi:hypothetical protein
MYSLTPLNFRWTIPLKYVQYILYNRCVYVMLTLLVIRMLVRSLQCKCKNRKFKHLMEA